MMPSGHGVEVAAEFSPPAAVLLVPLQTQGRHGNLQEPPSTITAVEGTPEMVTRPESPNAP
jgi:hypothetical protein